MLCRVIAIIFKFKKRWQLGILVVLVVELDLFVVYFFTAELAVKLRKSYPQLFQRYTHISLTLIRCGIQTDKM